MKYFYLLVSFLFVGCATTIPEPSMGIIAYPNPFIEICNVYLGDIPLDEFPAEFSFIDTRGDVIFTQEIIDPSQVILLKADADEPGTYALVLEGKNETYTSHINNLRSE